MTDTAAKTQQQVSDKDVRKAVGAAAMGNALEWFDFGVYGYLAVEIGRVFFPSGSLTQSLLWTFATFALGFLIRPLGGFFFGPLGDKIGRNRVLATTIILMSGATFAIGLLPSYAAMGLWAPAGLIILRLIQGFSTGGEYGGAATFMVEYASDKKRGFLSSWLEFGTLAGYAASGILVAVITALVTSEQMLDWGWRIPFLMAGPLGIVGLYLRLKLEDSPVFRKLEEAGQVSKSPLRDTFVNHWRQMLICVGLVVILNVAYYTVLKYMPTYLKAELGIADLQALILSLSILFGMMLLVTFVGRYSDKVGRKPVLYAACIGFILLAIPAFYLMIHGTTVLTFVGLGILGFLVVLLAGTMPATLPAIFPTHVRYGGFAISYNTSTSLFGGTAPLVITWLISLTNSNYIPAYYLMAAAVVSLIALGSLKETARQPLASPRIGSKPREETGLEAGD
ncbi:MAG TPA: MFS transporter [Gammaproteobacteria bacterium]|nr:MFS transporter [Gammaproteobacteria bacterium]